MALPIGSVPVIVFVGQLPDAGGAYTTTDGLRLAPASTSRIAWSPIRTLSELAAPGSAIEAGKHVICEKPLATTALQAAELVDLVDHALAARAGVVAAVPFVYRFHP